MFFTASKVFWMIANPGNLLLILFMIGMLALIMRAWRFGRRLIGLAVVLSLMIAIVPIGNHLLYKLENRFPVQVKLPEQIDGVIVLGGFSNQFVTKARGQVALNGAVERLIALVSLSKRYPRAKLVLTGGSGDLFRQNVKEVETLGPVLNVFGLQKERIVLEKIPATPLRMRSLLMRNLSRKRAKLAARNVGLSHAPSRWQFSKSRLVRYSLSR